MSGLTSIFPVANNSSAGANGPQREPIKVISSTTKAEASKLRLPA